MLPTSSRALRSSMPDSSGCHWFPLISDLIAKNRSYRRFYQDVAIETQTLKELVDLARLSASALNMQPLKYMLSSDPQRNAQIFAQLGWAAYLKDWPGPPEGERPSAYIVVLGDTQISRNYWVDYGITAQSILLGAVEKGLGGCMIATIRKKELAHLLNIDARYEILLVIALGNPKEKVVIEPMGKDGDVRYWHDSEGVHHVPKRSLDDIIVV
jgi:nitroreductase